ncbi:MAG: carbohydrate-binding domain-containing protein [Lachnospiraceae bacterium]|nr:carbohydrate-binding domain-containing protein [Lachnospiraceae bacterium]
MDKRGSLTAFFILLAAGAGLSFLYWGNAAEASATINEYEAAGPLESGFEPTRADMDMGVEGAEDLFADPEGNLKIITDAGTYRLSGKYSRPVIIEAEDQVVRLVLDNAEISTSDGPAIYIRSAGKVIITVVEGTENRILDSAYYSDIIPNGAIYSESDLTINGLGQLSVTGYRKDAIHTEGEFKLIGGVLSLRAKRCGIKANDGMMIRPIKLDIESEEYGLLTSRAGTAPKGTIEISAGEISVVAGDTAVYSAKDIIIKECVVYFKSVVEDLKAAGEIHVEEGIL